MGASTMEEGVLKLVHPGRHVEIHKEPITAAEVMRKNPRHCVTRPDVFKCPWIVVKPESILFPGTVFYIVPNRTIHRLIKARENHNQPPPRQNHSPKYQGHPRYPKQTSTRKSSAGSTPKHQDYGHWFKRPFKCTMSSKEEDSDESYIGRSYSESWSKVIEVKVTSPPTAFKVTPGCIWIKDLGKEKEIDMKKLDDPTVPDPNTASEFANSTQVWTVLKW
ncbi:hypothetical protein Acr_26g0008810 [Actinidia rufa]|uniref:Uncharacterized protein n=1 Tax=Actinidia rufa TaxID=165716 RepID=A0A7J0H3P1_9ERIC|nr:hypothetical protein Acr_26g0008810 [Actinidia rufa]